MEFTSGAPDSLRLWTSYSVDHPTSAAQPGLQPQSDLTSVGKQHHRHQREVSSEAPIQVSRALLLGQIHPTNRTRQSDTCCGALEWTPHVGKDKEREVPGQHTHDRISRHVELPRHCQVAEGSLWRPFPAT